MNALKMLRAHHAEAEIDAAVWIDNHDRLGRAVRFLAYHRVLRAAVNTARRVTVRHACQAAEGGW